MRQPPGGLRRADPSVEVAVLHADIPDSARLAPEEFFEELLEAIPFTLPAAIEQPGELLIALEAVVKPIDDHGDPGAAPERFEKPGICGHWQRVVRGTRHRRPSV